MHRPLLDIIVPIIMCCALLWWIGRHLNWTQRLAATAVTLAVIIIIVWLERGSW